tara:strand:- start:24 stop:236 length:213 start_codon:yes stop_codon:yes gene_type:complete
MKVKPTKIDISPSMVLSIQIWNLRRDRQDRKNIANTIVMPPKTDSMAKIRDTSNNVSLKKVLCPSEYPEH